MRTPSTSRIDLRLLDCNKRNSRHLLNNRNYSTLAIAVAMFLYGWSQIASAKPYAETSGPTGWATPRVASLPLDSSLPRESLYSVNPFSTNFPSDRFSEHLRVAMANQSAPTEAIDLEQTVATSDSMPVGDGTTWCNRVRLQDEIYVINVRSAGSCCDPAILQRCMTCQKFDPCEGRCGKWQAADQGALLSKHDPNVTTVFYVHGNRVSAGKAKQRCLTVYRRMLCCADSDRPIRFIVFSWPSTEIPGPLRDARVKAARTRPAGCQLAWVLDQIPGDMPIGLIGYSFGARVITGALHILDGGHLNGMCLSEHMNPGRQPVRVVMIAAATHAHWLGQGRYHGQALSQVDKMLSINNSSDMVMNWYHLSTPNGRPQAMGLCGPICVGAERHKIRNRNVSRYVGSEHNINRYLSSPGVACQLWQYAAWGE